MSQEELDRLYKDLEVEEKNLRNQLAEIANKSQDGYQIKVPNYGEHEDENAQEATDLDRNLALKRELEAKLNEIIKTKKKIKEGTYGKCGVCSKDISSQRLKVRPVAALCIDCAKIARPL